VFRYLGTWNSPDSRLLPGKITAHKAGRRGAEITPSRRMPRIEGANITFRRIGGRAAILPLRSDDQALLQPQSRQGADFQA
jgi:hypothetical protein